MNEMTCARCRKKPRMSQMTGCLCDDCEDAIEGMTQSELDADFAHYSKRPAVPTPQPQETP